MSEYSNDSNEANNTPIVYDGLSSFRKRKSINNKEIDQDVGDLWKKAAQTARG